MQVETYEVEPINQSEIQALAADGEAAMLIEKLNLNGQRSLQSASGTVCPYRRITKEELFAFKNNFPNTCAIEEYEDGPIPLRVLQCAAHVRELNLPDMQLLQVWYPAPGVADPVLVARPSSWQDPVYLIARWGDALCSIAELTEKAIAKLIPSTKAALLKARNEIDLALTDVETLVRGKAAEGSAPTINCYIH